MQNNQNVPLGPLNVSVGSVTAPFTYAGTNTCQGTTLVANTGTCVFDFRFAPLAIGAANGSANVTINGVVHVVSLSGTGVTVNVPASLGFDKAGVGDAGKVASVTVTNSQAFPLGPLSVSVGSFTGPFSSGPGSTCSGATLAATVGSCIVNLMFSPVATGAASGSATITINGLAHVVSLSGTGVTVTVPPSIAFGVAGAGDPPKPGTLTISNAEAFPLGPLTVGVTGVGTGFNYVNTTCTGVTLKLPSASSCSRSATFRHPWLPTG